MSGKNFFLYSLLLSFLINFFLYFIFENKSAIGQGAYCQPLPYLTFSGPWPGQGYLVMTSSTPNVLVRYAGTGAGIVSGSGSPGQIAFWSGASILSGDNNLFWDNTNKRLGIGTTTPQTALHVVGDITATNFIGNYAGTISSANVSSGVFGSLTGGGNFSFPAFLGISTSSQINLPQPLSVYGNAYIEGNLGIGTTTPTAKLYVRTTDTTTVPFQVEALVQPLVGWSYRRPITISNSGGALTDYQVLVTLDTQSLISAGKMRSDCGDIRFTDSNGSTLLNYWIESGCNTASTKIWVKVPSIPASSSKTIYVYYGNPSATSASTYNPILLKITKISGNAGGSPVVLEDIMFNSALDFYITQVGVLHSGNSTYDIYDTIRTLGSVTFPDRGGNVTWDYWLPNISYFGQRIQLRRVTDGAQYYNRFIELRFNSYPENVSITVKQEPAGNVYGGLITEFIFSQPMRIFINQFDLSYIADYRGIIYLKDSLGNTIWSVDPPDQSSWAWRSFTVNQQIIDKKFYFEMSPTGTGSNQFTGDRVYLVISQIPLISVGAEESSLRQQTVFYIQNQTGNVGLWTTTPIQKLHIRGDTYIEGNYYISGNVGIGTIMPTAKLEINGTMKFSGGVGPYCIFYGSGFSEGTCPSGWKDKGNVGFIYYDGGKDYTCQNVAGTCPYRVGGAFNDDWCWCHPRLCCSQ
jgi:hypothetical protein